MTPKEIVLEFYKSDVFLDKKAVGDLLHPEVNLEWNSSKGLLEMNYQDFLDYSDQLAKAYIRSKVKISHILQEGNLVSLRYSYIVKTIENPREDMELAKFFVIWEVKDEKLYKGFQMSHIS